MDVFKWGPAFFSVNEMFFERYLQCQTAEEMALASEEMVKFREQLRIENRQREVEMPSSGSDDEEEDEDEDPRLKNRGMMPPSSSDEEEDEERKSDNEG